MSINQSDSAENRAWQAGECGSETDSMEANAHMESVIDGIAADNKELFEAARESVRDALATIKQEESDHGLACNHDAYVRRLRALDDALCAVLGNS